MVRNERATHVLKAGQCLLGISRPALKISCACPIPEQAYEWLGQIYHLLFCTPQAHKHLKEIWKYKINRKHYIKCFAKRSKSKTIWWCRGPRLVEGTIKMIAYSITCFLWKLQFVPRTSVHDQICLEDKQNFIVICAVFVCYRRDESRTWKF